jgi:hypothetical protein
VFAFSMHDIERVIAQFRDVHESVLGIGKFHFMNSSYSNVSADFFSNWDSRYQRRTSEVNC